VRKVTRKIDFFVDFLALKSPWLYLCVSLYIGMWALVRIGNPLLPIQVLAKYGLAWHHIPELLAFLFLGMWFGSFGYLSSGKFNYFDFIPLMLLIIVSIVELVTYSIIFWLVLIVVTIPSFVGYFIIRWNKIQKTHI
jgi:hypothetical protein